MSAANTTTIICTNVYQGDNLEDRKKRYTELWIDIINKLAGSPHGASVK